MLVEISTTAPNATDLGFLLHKNPNAVYERPLPYGVVRVFYPEATNERCTAVLWLDMDQIGLSRGRGDNRFPLAEYVNDRSYVASSFVSVAIGQAFSTAMTGRSKERPERANELWPIQVTMPVVDCDAGADFIQRLFEPLGYCVEASPIPLDANFSEWGSSTLYRLSLSANVRVADALTHLYVLLPVLDNQKHYAFGAEEVTKLLDNAGEWLVDHPMRDVIMRRYLRYHKKYVEDARAALERLEATNGDVPQDTEEIEETDRIKEETLELPLRILSSDSQWRTIVGMDVSTSALKTAARRLYLDKPDRVLSDRIKLFHGSLIYRDERLAGFDAAALVEVIEHIEYDRLEFVERTIFYYAKPRRVVLTTPNADYNSHWPSLPAGKFRHFDHRFEWSRAQFENWTTRIAAEYGYSVEICEIGETDGKLGAPSQMAVFDRAT